MYSDLLTPFSSASRSNSAFWRSGIRTATCFFLPLRHHVFHCVRCGLHSIPSDTHLTLKACKAPVSVPLQLEYTDTTSDKARYMDDIGLGLSCRRCGDQIRIEVVSPRPAPVTNPLSEILDVGLRDRIIILAKCGCSSARMNAVRGATIYDEELDGE